MLSSFTLLLVLLSMTAPTNQVESAKHRQERAIGGETFSQGRWPWLVLLEAKIVRQRLFGFIPLNYETVTCGGVLISNQWVLSAAHCFADQISIVAPRYWKVRLGSVKLKPTVGESILNIVGHVLNNDELKQWRLKVERIFIHPDYNKSGFYNNDIALVKLSRSMPGSGHFPHIKAIQMPTSNDTDFPGIGTECVTKGWGCTSLGSGLSKYARQIVIPVMPNYQCETLYLEPMNARICAGYNNKGIGICKGDSGSPLVCQKNSQYILAGIASFTSRQKPESHPAVFTRVQDYIPWINRVTKNV